MVPALRRHRFAPLLGLLVVGLAGAQPQGPTADQNVRLGRQALLEAKQLLATNARMPKEAAYQIGLLQALLGDFDAGLGTITATPDPTGPGGPRWNALLEAAHIIASKGQVELVQQVAARQQTADRAAMLAGLAQAQFEAGQPLPAMLNLQEVGASYPAIAASRLLDEAEATQAKSQAPPAELLGRSLELARKIPPGDRVDGQSVQAAVLARLVKLDVAGGNDDAALQAAEAVADPDDRQVPLLALATQQAAAGRDDAAVGTITKLSTERSDPVSGVSLQCTGYLRLSRIQLAKGSADAARASAAKAAESAKRTVDNYVRVRSTLAAAEGLSQAGDKAAVPGLAAQALSEIHVNDQTKRALALLYTARVAAISGQKDVAETAFRSGREVVGLAKTPVAYDAAIAVPASVGLVSEANAGLALRRGPIDQRAGRMVLVRALAEGGYIKDATAAAREYAEKADDRKARIEALTVVAAAAPAGDDATLLHEAIGLATEPYDLASLKLAARAAGAKGLPGVALEAYQAAFTGAAKVAVGAKPAASDAAVGFDELLAAVTEAIRQRAAAGADVAGLASAAEQAALANSDPMARSAALTAIGQTIHALGDQPDAERLLSAAAREARNLKEPLRLVQALAEHGAAAASCDLSNQANGSFNAAEAMVDELDAVPAATLLVLAETEAQAGRQTAGKYLVRSLLTIENFGREGSTDLRRAARAACYVGQSSDALAMSKRIYRPEERLEAFLDLARVLAQRPVTPLRARDFYLLPNEIVIARPAHVM